MTRLMRQISAVLTVAVVLSACAAGDIRDANDRLTDYYTAKMQAEASDDWRMLETSMASLSQLANEAASQAADEAKVLNKVSLYRIAATAAWQGNSAEVVDYGRAGQALCTDEVYAQVPRDCGMLMVIPTLAGVNAATGRLNRLQLELDQAAGNGTAEQGAEAEDIKNIYFESIDRLLNARSRIERSDAHPAFKAGVDDNIVRIQCRLLDGPARGVIVLTSGSVEQFNDDLRARGCRMLEEGVAADGFSCAPQNCD